MIGSVCGPLIPSELIDRATMNGEGEKLFVEGRCPTCEEYISQGLASGQATTAIKCPHCGSVVIVRDVGVDLAAEGAEKTVQYYLEDGRILYAKEVSAVKSVMDQMREQMQKAIGIPKELLSSPSMRPQTHRELALMYAARGMRNR